MKITRSHKSYMSYAKEYTVKTKFNPLHKPIHYNTNKKFIDRLYSFNSSEQIRQYEIL